MNCAMCGLPEGTDAGQCGAKMGTGESACLRRALASRDGEIATLKAVGAAWAGEMVEENDRILDFGMWAADWMDHAVNGSTCAFCLPCDITAERLATVRAHVETCDKHPLSEANERSNGHFLEAVAAHKELLDLRARLTAAEGDAGRLREALGEMARRIVDECDCEDGLERVDAGDHEELKTCRGCFDARGAIDSLSPPTGHAAGEYITDPTSPDYGARICDDGKPCRRGAGVACLGCGLTVDELTGNSGSLPAPPPVDEKGKAP